MNSAVMTKVHLMKNEDLKMGGILLFLFISAILILSENYIKLVHFEFCQLEEQSPRHKNRALLSRFSLTNVSAGAATTVSRC